MPITTPTGIQISKQDQILVPAMAKQPLQRALENLNYLWKFHRPALVDVCPNIDISLGRSIHTLVYPITPSADGLRYDFEHRIVPTATSTCNITVDYTTAYAGAGTVWVNIYAVAALATVANTLLTRNDASLVIPATAVALRVDYFAAAGDIAPQHILIHPAPSNAVAGIQPSGFIPFHDGLLVGNTGAPVHTEFLNRCKISSLSLLRDRRQQVLSFLQCDAGVPWTECPGANAVDYTEFQDIAPVRLFFPHQWPTVTISIHALADVSAGATPDLIRVRQVAAPNAAQAIFAASGAIVTANLTLQLQGQGLERYADVAIGAKRTVGNSTRLRAISGYWRPGD